MKDYVNLFFDNFQNFHGACLDADAAGNALGGSALLSHDNDLHGACLNTLAALDAQLLVDHVNAGLGVLGDGLVFTDLHALAALDADHGLCFALLVYDLDAGQILMELLIESGGTCVNTLQTCHALSALFNCKLLHSKNPLYL